MITNNFEFSEKSVNGGNEKQFFYRNFISNCHNYHKNVFSLDFDFRFIDFAEFDFAYDP